jgi:Na+/H+-dicarboxylate symporter
MASKEKGAAFVRFLLAGNEVMGRVIGLIMLYAPVGLGSYIAYLVGAMGPQIMGSYGRVLLMYYPTALIYFFAAFSIYIFWVSSGAGLRAFWRHIPATALTALATGSSVATIPLNLEAARKMGVKDEVREVVIPLGATIHMEGSCLAAIVKIAFLFGLFQIPFTGWEVWGKAVIIAVLAGTVISGIPAGGMIGELLIITLYGFPVAALPLITMIGTIVDPPATMLNAVGDNVTCAMVSRRLFGPRWREDPG